MHCAAVTLAGTLSTCRRRRRRHRRRRRRRRRRRCSTAARPLMRSLALLARPSLHPVFVRHCIVCDLRSPPRGRNNKSSRTLKARRSLGSLRGLFG